MTPVSLKELELTINLPTNLHPASNIKHLTVCSLTSLAHICLTPNRNMMLHSPSNLLTILFITLFSWSLSGQSPDIQPDQIQFVRQGVKRLIFDQEQQITLSSLDPATNIGMPSMYPTHHYSEQQAEIQTQNNQLTIQSSKPSETSIWVGGFNPFASYELDLEAISGSGEIGYEFTSADQSLRFIVSVTYADGLITGVTNHIKRSSEAESTVVSTKNINQQSLNGRLIIQMLGSGYTAYIENNSLPIPIGQFDFAEKIDLRQKKLINSLQSRVYLKIKQGQVIINKAKIALNTGLGQADIRAITYEDGSPYLDAGRLWYTMSIRGRALPHHVQGVFSMNPSVFDLRLEGVIVFDRGDGLLRNEIASHLFYDRKEQIWRGLTTGFSAYAIKEEKKQLLAIESQRDPRFGFSIMKSETFGIVGDIEDPHLLLDTKDNKWRILTCVNQGGYKAVVLESDFWNRDFKQVYGPVAHNSTGTSIQKIGNQYYCFSGSSEREIFIYTYPDLKDAGTLQMDLPPWDENAGTRVWPNVVQLPEGYPYPIVALMMDRYNYPGVEGPNWTYGALYLYHGAVSED